MCNDIIKDLKELKIIAKHCNSNKSDYFPLYIYLLTLKFPNVIYHSKSQ